MVKFSSETNHGKLLGLGISEINVQKLKEGCPILVKAEDLHQLTGWKGEVFLFYGRTEEEIKDQLSSHIGPDTVVKNA